MEININTAFYDSIRQSVLSNIECDDKKNNFINIIENNKVFCDKLKSSIDDNIFKKELKKDELLKINRENEIINVIMKINVGNHVIGKICNNLKNVSLYGKNDYILFTKNKIFYL